MEGDFYKNLVDAIKTADIPLASRLDLIEGAADEQEKRRKLEEDNERLRENNELLKTLLQQQQAKLDNRTESVDVSGGKEDTMYKYRGHFALPNGEIKEITGKSVNDAFQKVSDATVRWLESEKIERRAVGHIEEGPTFKEYAEQMIQRGVRKTFKRDKDQGYLRNWVYPQLGSKPIKSITFSDCQTFANYLSVTPSPREGVPLDKKTAGHVLTALTMVLNNAVRDDIISKNPCKGVRNNNKKGKQRYRALSNEEQKIIMRTLPTITEENVKLYLALSLSTGMRPEEIAALEWSDYHADIDGVSYISVTKAVQWSNLPKEQKKPIIKDTKTENGHRDIPIMLKGAVEILNTARQAGGFIIRGTKTNKDGQEPITAHQKSVIDNTYNKHCQAAGVTDRFTGYDLRHTISTILNDVGATKKSTKVIMGHADEDFTQRTYTHSSWRQVVEDAEKVSAHFDSLHQA